MDQLSRLSIILNDNEIFDEVIALILELKEDKDKNELYKIDELLISMINGFTNALPKYHELYKNVLLSSLDRDISSKHLEYYKNYLKLLFSEKNYSGLFSAATQMNLKYPREMYPLGKEITDYSYLIIVLIIILFINHNNFFLLF